MAGILSKESVAQKVRQINPYECERFVAKIWEQRGYDTTVRSGSGDRGIDVVAEYGSEKVLIQVKRYGRENKVGSQTVRKYATLYQQVDDADQVMIVSSGFFTSEAEQLASNLDIEAVDVNNLFRTVESYAADVAVNYLSGKAFSEAPGETKPTASDVFGDANRFKRMASEQGIFEGCPNCAR
jgi:restriction system protein